MTSVVCSSERSAALPFGVTPPKQRAELLARALIGMCRVVTVVLFIAFTCFIAAKCFTALGDYDGMYNSILPKNFVIGEGYKSTYPAQQGYIDRDKADQDRYFNVEITTGPTLLFYSIPLLFVFGSQYWVPAVSAASLSTLLLLVSLLWLRRFWPEFGRSSGARDYWWTCAALTLALFISFTADVYWPGNPWGVLRPWYEFVGEVPASLFTIIGSLVLFGRGMRPPWAIIAGLLLGLAILAKSLAAIACGIILAFYVLWRIFQGGSWKNIFWSGGLATAGIAAPVVAYDRLIQHALGSPAAIEEWRIANRVLFNAVGSGISQFTAAPNKIDYLLGNLSEHVFVFLNQFPVWQVGIIIVVSLALIGSILVGMKRARRSLRAGEALGLAIMAAVTVHYGWWFQLEHYAWIRRLTQANLLLAFALALLVSQAKNRRLHLTATCLLIIAAMGPGFWRFISLYDTAFMKEPRLADFEQVRPVLDKSRADGFIILGCLWSANREIDFVLPTSRNVYDCTAIQPVGWGKHAVLVRGFYWFLARKDARVMAMQEACERNILIANESYTISRCPDEMVEQHYMWPGFYRPEPHGRWMGKTGIMPILSRQRGSELKLSLTAVRPVVGSVEVRADGQTLLTQSITIGELGGQEIVVPQSVVSKADSIIINVDRTFNPAKLGFGPDVRDLGVFVSVK